MQGRLSHGLMAMSHRPLWWVAFALAAAGLGAAPSLVLGQTTTPPVGGVSIDADGVLRREVSRRESSAITQRRQAAFAQENLPADLNSFTDLRKISLRAIEEELNRLSAGAARPVELEHLYGLQRLDYIFLDSDRGDVVLAGPEGFAPDNEGRMVGLTTGRPPLRLDDLLVALRAEPQARGTIGCSIDPDAGRLARMQEYIRRNSTPAARNVAQARYKDMAEILGRQDVTVWGVPAESHFALTLVTADYRMKLIALGKENPGIRGLRSQLSLLAPQGNTMQRWWFLPLYDPLEADEAGLSFHLSGQRVQVLSQEEWTDAGGNRSDAPFTRSSTQKFAQLFTEHFEELAKEEPVFAELQNVFDLAVLAALLRRQDAPRRLNWPMAGLLDAARTPTDVHPVPRYVESLFATTNRSQFVLGLIGGVTLNTAPVVQQPFNRQKAAELGRTRSEAVSNAKSDNSRRWWD
jgi:hypothetical protein